MPTTYTVRGEPLTEAAFAPFGQVIAEAPSTEEAVLIAECDPHHVEEVRRNWPFLRDRRIDAYSPILKRWLD